MEKGYTLISPCFFGMEKMLANEIKNLGFEIVKQKTEGLHIKLMNTELQKQICGLDVQREFTLK